MNDKIAIIIGHSNHFFESSGRSALKGRRVAGRLAFMIRPA